MNLLKVINEREKVRLVVGLLEGACMGVLQYAHTVHYTMTQIR